MGKWGKDRLGSLGNIVAGGTPSTNVDAYWDGEIPFVTPYDLSKCTGVWIDKTARYITKAGLENSAANLLPPQSIVISTRAPIGYIALTTEPSVSNQGCKSVVLKEDQDKVFHCYNLSTYVGEMKRLGVGTTFSEISKADLSRIKVWHPVSLDEQRHIAEILTTCDEVIEESVAVVDKYRAIKAGMLKDLFTRGIGKNGKVRPKPAKAPDLYKWSELGLVPKDWEVKRLGDCAETSSGGTPSRSIPEYYHGDIKWFTTTELKDCFLIDSNEHISKAALCSSSAKIFPSGTLLIAMYGATIGRLGILTNPAATNQACCAIFTNDSTLTSYLYFYLLSERSRIIGMGSGAGQQNVSQAIIGDLTIKVPPKDEQSKITERLAVVDDRIGMEEKTIAKYRKVKAGLMARLLTPPDMEVE